VIACSDPHSQAGAVNGATVPLRVCHLGKFYPPASGGIESHLQTLAQAQARLGMAVDVLCVNHRNHNDEDVTWRRFAATPTMREHDGPVELTRFGRRASLARLECCLGLPRRLWRTSLDQYDLLHVHVPNPTMVLGLFLCRPRVPWVISYHSDVIRQRALLLLQRPFENWVFRRARAVFAASPSYVSGSRYLQRFADKVTVNPYGIDLAAFLHPSSAARQAAERFRATYGEPLWLAVGRLVYYKGLANAIAALTRVPGRLMIVGEGPLRGELEHQARSAGVADRIAWHSGLSRDELIGAYLASTALWFPSNARSEAFGIVQIEAMACGRPVLNSAIPGSGVAWVSRDGETGLTVPVDDWQALAAAARRLWQDAELRGRFGAQARRRAVSEFDAERMARRVLAVYQSAACGVAPATPQAAILT
jgi:rhamnosyl/mannosyltransferase